MDVITRVRSDVVYRRALRHPELERRDPCAPVGAMMVHHSKEMLLGDPEEVSAVEQAVNVGDVVPHGGKVIAVVPGMGKVIDWRPSSWTPVNGGKIKPTLAVNHIPVIPQAPWFADFVTLRNVLVVQGLMVQNATDAEGNVALFTPNNYLCFQAAGANQQSTGCEHMHATTGEVWTRAQLCAAAYVWERAWREVHVPAIDQAVLGNGNGVVRVSKPGQTTHKAVADAAGFHNRSDPGSGYDSARVAHNVRYFRKHGNFKGA